MAKSLSPKRKKLASSATSLKNNPAKSKFSSPTAVSVANRKKKKKKASADASIELDYSGPTTPKKKINSLTGKSVLGSTLCQNINLTSTRNCVETVPENYRPPGFDPRIGNFC